MSDSEKHEAEGIGIICSLGVTHHDICPCRKSLESQLATTQIELTNARSFIESQRMTLATCDQENKNVHAENLRLEAKIEKLDAVRVAAEKALPLCDAVGDGGISYPEDRAIADELRSALAAAKGEGA